MPAGVRSAAFLPSFPLVDAKLRKPVLRPWIIRRDRLVRVLMAEPRTPVVSVVAPAGYGKSILLADWASRERRPVTWLTIDDYDNEPSVFLTYLAAALDRFAPIDPTVGRAIGASRERVLATAVPRLAAAAHRIDGPAVLILDDAHRLVDRTCLDALLALIDHLPDGFQIVLAGRAQPDLNLARLRARRDLLELGASELALDVVETRELAAAAGCSLTPDQAHVLRERTEGWATGIYLATLAGTRSLDPGRATVMASGQDSAIAGYLRSELLSNLGDDDQTFLTRSSILEVVEPAVAEAVTGIGGAAERLRSLARDNRFVAPLTGGSQSYRFHQMLSEYLRAELELREPGATMELHRRAAAWFEREGRVDVAIEHALAGADEMTAARLVMANALPIYYAGHADLLDRWIRNFGESTFERLPPLAVVGALVNGLRGRAEAAERLAYIAERSTFTGSPGDGSASFESARAILRAAMARHGPDEVLASSQLAVAAEPATSPWRPMALYGLGAAHVVRGEFATADAVLAEAVDDAALAGTSPYYGLAMRASLAIMRGDWPTAERLAQESHAAIDATHLRDVATAIHVHAVSARVAIHRGDSARGREELVHAQLVRPLASSALPWIATGGLIELARAYLAIADTAGAKTVVTKAEAVVRRRPDLGWLAESLVELRRQADVAASSQAGASTLTPAELRVLPLLSTHLTFQDIADRFCNSRSTIHSHAVSIYSKLGVTGRSEAVERAIEFGLLEPFPGLRLTTGSRPELD
ncbi:MAG: LuxR C-terminal-related transcriptional regulator [Chloroflexota bacterium]|nr:LuxR C-terminal-related transcriptional regulator [Chloroflexota bacterium]MDH5243545.1 LuxR C-terminal-related transcriptional regulator [Chloroflexota bacterium]